MVFKQPKKITSWSYSRYACYEECPAKAKYKFIDKLPEPGSDAMDRGIHIHKLAEDYVAGEIKVIPPELRRFEAELDELKASNPSLEETWAFTKDWKKTTWDDWAGCAVRIKTDASCFDGDTLYIIDHKTGKMRSGYDTQMSLYGLGGMLRYPTIKNVNAQLWFLDQGDTVEVEYDIKEMPTLLKDWEKRTKPMLNDTTFAPKPGNACRWCHFSKAKGGPCKF